MVQYNIEYAGELVVIQNIGGVNVLEFPRPDVPFVAAKYFSDASLFAGFPGFALAGSDTKTYIALLDVERRWGIRIELDRGDIQQIVFNTFLSYHRQKYSNIYNSKTSAFNNEPVYCLDCLLRDGSIWTWFINKEDCGKLSTNDTLGSKFSDKFHMIEGLTGVQRIYPNNLFINKCEILYLPLVSTTSFDDKLKLLEYAPKLQEPDYFTTHSHTGKYEVAEPVEYGLISVSRVVPKEAKVCIAADAPDEVGFFLYMGCLLPLHIHQKEILPQSLAARRDIEECTMIYIPERGVYQFYVTVSEYKLIVYFGDELGYLHSENEYFVGGDEKQFVRWTDKGLIDEVFCFPSFSHPIVYCRVYEDQFIELFDRKRIQDNIPTIPRALRPLPTKYTPVQGTTEARKYSVAISHKYIFILQNDNTIVRLKFVNEQPQIEHTSYYKNIVSVSAGWNHFVALLENGTVQAELLDSPVLNEGERNMFYMDHGWPSRKRGSRGAAHYDQHIVPKDLTDVVGVYCGDWVTYALRRDGTVVAWGRNDFSQMESAHHIEKITQVCGGHMHALFRASDSTVHHIGVCRINYHHIYPELTENIKRLHTSGNWAVAVTNDGRVIDLFSEELTQIASDPEIVDAVVMSMLYVLLYSNGRVEILNRFSIGNEDDDAQYTDPIILVGIESIVACEDHLVCVGFDGRLSGLYADAQRGTKLQIRHFPPDLRAKTFQNLTKIPNDYDADACHEANTLALRLGVIKQTNTYMHAPKRPQS